MNNVEIQVWNRRTHEMRKPIRVHNKVTRKMVEGVMRYLQGHFTQTFLNNDAQYSSEIAEKYIPRFIGFGCGGIVSNDTVMYDTIVPDLDDNWNRYVSYNSTELKKELFVDTVKGVKVPRRFEIKKITSTFVDKNGDPVQHIAEMDSLMFMCEVSPDEHIMLDQSTNSVKPFFVTEVGMFSKSGDMLSYLKLGNYPEMNTGTDFAEQKQSNCKCTGGVILFNTPDSTEDSIHGIRVGSFSVTVGGIKYKDSAENPGALYVGEELAGAVSYDQGIVRLYEDINSDSAEVHFWELSDMILSTDTIYVRPDDSIVVRWVITLAAIGRDNVFRGSVVDERGNEEEKDTVIVPELGTDIIVYGGA